LGYGSVGALNLLTEEAVVRRACLLFVVFTTLVAAPSAQAGGRGHRDWAGHGKHRRSDHAAIVPAGLAGAPLLTEWWREPLSKSADDPTNPFISGGCRMITRSLALDYLGQCTVPRGTWIFEPAYTVECSNVEPQPFHADTPLEAALCGLRNDRLITAVTISVDGGDPVSLLGRHFGTFMLPGRVVIPQNSLFGGTPGEIMRYGGHGYVAFIRPLPVGEHTQHTHVEGTVEGIPPEGLDFDTTITVTPEARPPASVNGTGSGTS
jgi:hypothetical protein